ncbi:hypothetical protein HYPSUDRAFT_204950 [Hypholoma sublateritium FD-334 SS-4]|uniref:F-box domain-containing protein n=1 Tax=Hypholoma sublateritium (strain FD-334 SS-4) TaxID=945553 RepID=A0A0D2PG01_HYPSF|nr:hypothetical protein HYPSUDRAFT_204950 [Hypholoma sublateritium FD-334 SS-4]
MDQDELYSKSVLETLLKTNRPPTDQETAIIRESMAPANAILNGVEVQITEMLAYIEELKSQVEQAETKLQRLREEEAAILEGFADHRLVFSPFRNIPEDVLREICIQACVDGDMPRICVYAEPMPYRLAKICRGMRYIVLTTPIIWASLHVEINAYSFSGLKRFEQGYSAFARRASAWFERAGGLGLTVSIKECSDTHAAFEYLFQSDPSTILVNTLTSYSSRWKELQIDSRCGNKLSPLMTRIAALTAVDLPLLQSVSLRLDCSHPDPPLHDSVLLKIPTLKRIKLETCNIRIFTVDWAILTSITLCGISDLCDWPSKSDITRILRQTKSLVFCNIAVGLGGLEEQYTDYVCLPSLKTLIVSERHFGSVTSEAPSILDLITAPFLEICHMYDQAVFDFADFFKWSPRIRKLSLPYGDEYMLFSNTMFFLSHCPALTELSLFPSDWDRNTVNGDGFLEAFVEGDPGVICPHLQHSEFAGTVDSSLYTLRLIVEGKQGDIAEPTVMSWKKVDVDIRGIEDTETRQRLLDHFLRNKAAGMDIRARG